MVSEQNSTLDDLRVLEIAEGISGPFCARLFSDLGARVIKVERPATGDALRRSGPFLGGLPGVERSALFMYLNAGKESVTLDISQATGKEILRRLCKTADLVVDNMPHEYLRSVGFDYEAIREENAALVMLSIAPFGRRGSRASWKSHELTTFQMSLKGYLTPEAVEDPERERPLKPAGHMGAFLAGITAAAMAMPLIYQAKVSGVGACIDVSEQECVLSTALVQMLKWFYSKKVVKRSENLSAIGAVIGLVACADGYLQLTIMEDHQWESLVKLMGNPEWAEGDSFKTSTLRGINWPIIRGHLEDWARHYTKEEVASRAQQHRVPCLPVNNARDALRSEQLAARGFFTKVSHLDADVTLPRMPFVMSEINSGSLRRPPLLGEHNNDVYCGELGFSRRKLVKLYEAGII